MNGEETPDVVRRAIGDGAWNAAALAVPGVGSVIVVAYLFRSLGATGFAPWATAVALLGLLTILDAGLSATTARSAARAIAGDPEAVRFVRTAYAAYAGLALVVLVVGSALAPLVPAILGLGGEGTTAAIAVGVILAADLAIVTGTAGWHGTLRGARRFDLVFASNTTQAAISLPLTVLLVPVLGLPGAAIAQLGGRLAGRGVAAAAVMRVVPWIAIVPGRVTRADLRLVGLFALPILAMAIATQLGVGSDPIVVALVAGPATVGLYAVGSGLVRYVAFLVFPVLGVLLPSLSEASFRRPVMVASIVLRCVRLAAAIGVIVFGSIAVTAGPLLDRWIGRADGLTVAVVVAYGAAYAVWTPSQVLSLALIATGRHGLMGLALIVDSVANVALSVVLAFAIGPIGVAVSSVLLLGVVHGIAIPAIAIRHLGLPAGALVRALAMGGAAGVLVVAVVALIPAGDVIGLALRGSIAAGSGLAVLLLDQRASRSLSRAAPTRARSRPRSSGP